MQIHAFKTSHPALNQQYEGLVAIMLAHLEVTKQFTQIFAELHQVVRLKAPTI